MFSPTEGEFQESIIQLAKLHGWLIAHFRPARTASGWRTPVSADGAGFPDLILTRNGKLLVVELKSKMGKLSAAQERWLEAFRQVENIGVYVWRPGDTEEIIRVLG